MTWWQSSSPGAKWMGVIALVAIVALIIFAAYSWPVSQDGESRGAATGGPKRDSESLRQAVVSSGRPCSSISAVFVQGTLEGSEYRSVRCANGREYEVQIDRNGSMHVLDCDVLARLATRPCFTLLRGDGAAVRNVPRTAP